MTISTTTTTITYSGNGVTTSFTFPFVGAEASDIVVTLTTPTGVNTVLSPTLYSIVFNAIPTGELWAVGGTVNYPLIGSPIAAGYSLSITRQVPYIQDISISNQGAFYPQAVEQGLDLLEMQVQQSQTDHLYALRAPVTDGTPPNNIPSKIARANSYLAFDANGQPIATTITAGAVPGSTATARRINTTGTSTVNVLTTDSFGGVAIYQSSTPVTTIQLQTTGGPYPITDGGGNAGTSNITVLPPAGKTIDGQSSYVMNTNYQSVTFSYDGTQVLIGSGSQGIGNNISVPGSITAGTTITAGGTIVAGTGLTTTTGSLNATAGFINDKSGNVRNIVVNKVFGPYTLVASDNGKLVSFDGNLTLPSGVFTPGNNFMGLNRGGGITSIIQGSGTTLFIAATSTTGNRGLAPNGICTVLCVDTETFVISGVGLS